VSRRASCAGSAVEAAVTRKVEKYSDISQSYLSPYGIEYQWQYNDDDDDNINNNNSNTNKQSLVVLFKLSVRSWLVFNIRC